jgi:hypothetical protein
MARSYDDDAGPGRLPAAAALLDAAVAGLLLDTTNVPDSTLTQPPPAALLDPAAAAHLPDALPPRRATL